MNFNDVHAFYTGLGNSEGNSSLPPTALPDSRKGKKWERVMVDAIESIGEQQLAHNMKFRDYYKMIEGRLNYVDAGFQELPEFTKDIKAIREEHGIPTFLKHYDIIGIIVNALVGVYSDFKEVYRIDSIDEYSENEFIREKTLMLQQYAQEEFSLELQKLLIQSGINPNKTDFKSEEEKQAYIQQLEQSRQALTPEGIDKTLSKNFKVLATEWAENTIEEDTKRFYLDELDRQEFVDYLLTGRCFRHYKIGYDEYKIERWDPLNTFFSQDVDAKYPQRGEFVGRIHFYSPSDIINRYGYMMTPSQQEKISNYYGQSEKWGDGIDSPKSFKGILEGNFADTHQVPFKDYYDHKLLKEFESATGQPLGERYFTDDSGEEQVVTDYLPEYQDDNFIGYNFAYYMRDDIEVRRDVIQVTEGYFRNYRRIGLLTFQNEDGVILQEVVTDDLLKEFIEKYEIKKLRSVSLEELEEAQAKDRIDEYINTIVYTYHPEIVSFVKINNTNSRLKDDLYFVKPLPFQIKGNSNIYDFELPVTGYIGNSIALKLRPYQQMVNLAMNQVWNILEKEIGIFFLMDINYLPSEFMEDSDTEDALWSVRELARDVGFLPVDMSRQNLQSQQPFNSFIRQDLTYGSQVEYRMMLAEKYKQLALEQIGITPQLLGQPNKYLTSEGVSQGAQASYAQISPIFDPITVARSKDKNVHLAVAQYCQANNLDASSFYRKSDGDHYYLNIMQEDGELFPLRHLGVVSIISPKDNKRLEQLKQIFTQNNTLTNDLEAFTQLWNSDTMTEVIHIAKEASRRAQAQEQAKMEHEQTIVDKQIQAKAQEKAQEHENEKEITSMKIVGDIEEKRIDALGRAADNNANIENLNFINREADRAAKKEETKENNEVKNRETDRKIQADRDTFQLKMKELALKAKEIEQRKQETQVKKYTSEINKN